MDECIALLSVLNNSYPELFYKICAKHKKDNISRKLSKKEVGDNYFKLLINLPYNESYFNVNKILLKFWKS